MPSKWTSKTRQKVGQTGEETGAVSAWHWHAYCKMTMGKSIAKFYLMNFYFH